MCRLKCGNDNLEFRQAQITRNELNPLLKHKNIIFSFMLEYVSKKTVYSVYLYIEMLHLCTSNEVFDNQSWPYSHYISRIEEW
jgi:predicted nucleic acid-binding protein